MTARELLESYGRLINEHRFELIEPLLAPDCSFYFTSGTHVGVPAARAAFEKTWAMIEQEVYTLSEVTWIAEADRAAACTYRFHWRGVIKGEPREGRGRGTSCFRRDESGWKLVHEHLSAL